MKLTNDLLKRAVPEPGKRLELRDDDEPGLIFRVTDKGVRSWSVRYRNAAGEHRRKALGPFPAVTLSRAREEARKLKGEVASGKDVVGEHRAQRAAEANKKLFRLDALADAYFEDAGAGLHRVNAKGPKRASTLKEERRIFDRLVLPSLERKAVPDIKRADVQSLVTKLSKSSAANGRQALAVLRQLMSYAIRKDIIEANPAHDIAVAASQPRARVMTDEEIRKFWRAAEAPQAVKGLNISIEMGRAFRIALATLQRGGEVVGMRWSEVDEKRALWSIPAERMKGKRHHLVPLSDMALSLLAEIEERHPTFVFHTGRTDTHLDRRAFSRAMNRMCGVLEIDDATPHDFRRTGATNLTSERIGIPRFIVSQVIAHAGDTGGAAAVTGRHYDLNDYLPEKRKALNAWAELLQQVVTAVPAGHAVQSVTTRNDRRNRKRPS